MSQGDVLAFVLLVTGALFALVSAIEMDASYYEGGQREAWLWGASFLVASFISVYGFWRLV